MQRRDFVKAIVAASMTARSMFGQQAAGTQVAPSTPPPTPVAPGPVPWMRGLTEVKPLPMTPLVPDVVAQTNAHFFTTQQMATLRRLSEIMLPPLNAEAKQRCGTAFADIQPAQADQLLHPWLRTWMSDHPPAEPFAQFINVAHGDIRTATINSQAWSEAAGAAGDHDSDVGLYWFPIEPDMYRENAAPTRRP